MIHASIAAWVGATHWSKPWPVKSPGVAAAIWAALAIRALGGRVRHGRRRDREERAGEDDGGAEGGGDELAGTATHGDSHDSVTGRPGSDGTPP